MLDDLWLSNRALDRRFPDGIEPFKMVARLVEECGELSAEVQLWEDAGLKRAKHGPPDPKKTAKEVMDVLRAALRIASYYQLHDLVEATVRDSVAFAVTERLLTAEEVAVHRSGNDGHRAADE
jgi:NTP pyrophosphatase (non-canonical NTP hydrolase)